MRAARRAVALALALAGCVLLFIALRMRGRPSLEQRARWLQGACRLVLQSLQIRCSVEGAPPRTGLLVANHLSYLDIAILSAIQPCFFVAKAEIAGWPYFGWAARTGGTLFLNRASRASARSIANEIGDRMKLGVPVAFFPEGTSTDGSTVLHFHPWLFEPAIIAGAHVTPAAITYRPEGGAEEKELCWYGDAGFLSHLWKALAIAGFTAHVAFGEGKQYCDRTAAAKSTHESVAEMRARAARLEE